MISVSMMILVAVIHFTEGETQLQDFNSSQNISCLGWTGLIIENCTVGQYCGLHSDFHCVPLGNLGVGCVQAGMCMTYDDVKFLRAGFCPYHPHNTSFCRPPLADYYEIRLSMTLSELDNFICGAYNREGQLCSRCKPGYGPAVYAFSLMCVECSESGLGWALYFFLVLFPITVFYFIIIIFNIRATSPPFAAFVFLCQTFSNVERVHVPLATKLAQQQQSYFQVLLHIVRVLCGIWNLDFFRYLVPSFCVSSHLRNIHALTLEYVDIVYPFVLIIVTYICVELHARNFKPFILVWKPFHKCFVYFRRSWDPTASIINAFSTLVLIYLSKLVFITSLSVFSTKVYGLPHHYHFVYFDPSIKLFSKHHLPYLILSIAGISFVFIVSLLLSLYPTKVFRKLLEFCLPLHWRLAIHAFVETFQGHYKDGTNGTKDYRAVSGLHFCLQIIIVACYSHAKVRVYFITYLQMFLASTSLFYALTRPCKLKSHNFLLCVLSALTAFIILLISFSTFYALITMLFLLLIPHCGFAMLKVIQKVWTNSSCCRKLVTYLRTKWSERYHHGEHRDEENRPCQTEQTRLLNGHDN